MAKKKASKEKDVEVGEVLKTSKAITKDYGDVIKKASDVLEELKSLEILSWSPVLDNLLNGGIREGTIVGVVASAKEGKTTSILHFFAKNQKLHPEKTFVYVNTEGRLNADNLSSIKGLDLDNLVIVESTKERKLSGEDYLDIVERYINLHPGAVIAIDSLSDLIPECELEGKINASKRDKLPRLLSVFFKRCTGSITNNKIILFCVAHFIADTGPSRQTRMTDCGNMFKYQVQTNLEISYSQPWDDADDHIGQKMNWKVLTSNTGAKPRSTDVGWLRYGLGIDEVQELMSIACEMGVVSLAGSWYTLTCLMNCLDNPQVKELLVSSGVNLDKLDEVTKFFKFQGMTRVSIFLNDNPFLIDLISNDIKEINRLAN